MVWTPTRAAPGLHHETRAVAHGGLTAQVAGVGPKVEKIEQMETG